MYGSYCVHIHLAFAADDSDWHRVAEFLVLRSMQGDVPHSHKCRWAVSGTVHILRNCHTYVTHTAREAHFDGNVVVDSHRSYLSSRALKDALLTLCMQWGLELR